MLKWLFGPGESVGLGDRKTNKGRRRRGKTSRANPARQRRLDALAELQERLGPEKFTKYQQWEKHCDTSHWIVAVVRSSELVKCVIGRLTDPQVTKTGALTVGYEPGRIVNEYGMELVDLKDARRSIDVDSILWYELHPHMGINDVRRFRRAFKTGERKLKSIDKSRRGT